MTSSAGGSGGAGGMGGAGGGPGMPMVVVNEVESSGGVPGDWAELYNAGTATADLSGWVFQDNNNGNSYTIPNGTTIAPGVYLVLDEANFGFGLGANDSARLFDAGGMNVIDSYSWPTHAATTYGRCPDGTGAFQLTGGSTKGAANNCMAGGGGGNAVPWPGTNMVTTVDAPNSFAGNLSGLAYQPAAGSAAVLWAVRNSPSTLFRLLWNGTYWVPDSTSNWNTGKTLRYPNGTGAPDAEGVGQAEWSSNDIYVATERDNNNNQVSRMSVLLFDKSAPGAVLTASREWNLTSDLPVTGANTGLEGVTWIPDSHLVAKSFRDERLAKNYDPMDYPGHGTGLFIVGVEATGMLYAYALDHAGGGFLRVATIASGHPSVAEVVFDRETGYLWAHCDDLCGNVVNVLEIDNTAGSATFGRLLLRRSFARPSTLVNAPHEGFAIAPESECSNGFKPVFWADDAETGGNALRRDAIPCGHFF